MVTTFENKLDQLEEGLHNPLQVGGRHRCTFSFEINKENYHFPTKRLFFRTLYELYRSEGLESWILLKVAKSHFK